MRFFKNFLFLLTGKPQINKKISSLETLSLIMKRRSCRSFTDDEIDDNDFCAVLEAGRFAPSTVNLQTWSFITFTKEQWQDTFQQPLPFKGMRAIVICADLHRLENTLPDFKKTPLVNISFAIFNAGLSAMNMTIAAEALGLRSIMLSETGKTGLLDYSHLKERLHLPEKVFPVTTLVIGKGKAGPPGIPPRQPWNAVVMEGRYREENGDMLKDWFQQMFIGFKMTHPFSNFQKQLAYYRKKMAHAEEELKQQFRLT